jgi:rubrerythrin
MSEKKFTRKIEDFKCEHCGTKTRGTGYTDHCPSCLWSKHVDLNPGDRKATCRGMMEPVGVEIKSKKYTIHYRCLICGFRHRVKANPADNFEKILKLAGRPIK